jgi:hypothetical protein
MGQASLEYRPGRRPARPAGRLAIGGLGLNLFGSLGYFWLGSAVIGPGRAWFSGLVWLGALAGAAGVLTLGAMMRGWRLPLGPIVLAQLVLVPAALPLMWMLPVWFGYRLAPAGIWFEFYSLNEPGKYMVYALGLAWLASGLWLITRPGLLDRPGPLVWPDLRGRV